MKRAKTITGLFFQVLRTRWAALGTTTKAVAIVGMLLAAAFAVKATCLFGGCQAASSPCPMTQSPCQRGAMMEQAYEPAVEASEDDVPPCHRR